MLTTLRKHRSSTAQTAPAVRRPSARRRGVATIAALALTATLAACGNEGHSSTADLSATQTASNGDMFNGADVDFATQMIPHHAQAVQMVVMTQGRDLSPEVQDLTATIRDAQVPEVEAMTDWLTAWGQEIPETSLDHANAGHDMSGHSGSEGDSNSEGMNGMPGMMSDDDMAALEHASGAEFERMWLELMIEHHKGAIEMAQVEQEDGLYPDAVALAETIVFDQQAEIERMEELLG
ncbi:DUF305 domain-containing protein [Nocardioides abyssi]|uniref:DUF305 domain-containing protein n=1 Tax=Nocardioides abyssi TaxID=3058370 RepID=A0ABT8EUP1_9ACTN|nr:DUF305 domain-containing protein [Nocardioides abyssi]MDN4161893.1 DUF305 domain-containing protein [Nocardioides abyssi]